MIGRNEARQQMPTYSQQIKKSRIERVIFASQKRSDCSIAVENAQQLLSETMAIVSAIETRLEKLLAIVERASCDRRSERRTDRRASQAKEFEAICTQIDQLTELCSARGSLIDSSAFALSIDLGLRGQSKIQIPHVNLTAGPEGLGLREEAERLLQTKAHQTALNAVQQAFQTLQRVQEAYSATSRWLDAA